MWVDWDPGSAYSHLGKGMALRGMGLHVEAQQSFDRALELDPEITVPPEEPPGRRDGNGASGYPAAAPVPLNMGTKGAVCKRGHALEGVVMEDEEFGEPCPTCGADVMTECPRCGLHFGMGAERADVGPACARCGEAFPWSAEARRARRAAFLRILGAVGVGIAIISGALYISTFFR